MAERRPLVIVDGVKKPLPVGDTTPGTVPAGAVFWFAANSPPTGYLRANGATVSRTTYAALFAVIGTTFGAGDGSTTFKLPDLRGEFVRGWDDSRGVDSGRSFGSAQSGAIESHQHVVQYNDAMNGGSGNVAPGSQGTVNSSINTGATGGSETRPRNIALLACIKY